MKRLACALLILSSISRGAALHLKHREIRPETGRSVSIEPPGPRWTSGRSHLMLQFQGPWNERILQELNRRGAFVVGALPDSGVMVSVRDDFSTDRLDLAWTGRLDSSDKISPALERGFGHAVVWLVAEFFPDVDMTEAMRLAQAAGFQVHDHPDLIPTHLLLSGPSGRLRGLAQWDEVAYLFPAAGDLIRGERVRSCAGSLSAAGLTPMYVVAGTGWPKDATGQVTLHYVFGDLTPKAPADQVTQELLRALNAWTSYAPVKFVAGDIASARNTLWINFFSQDHGDGFPFDGPGGSLAHTFYPAPPNPEPIAGDMHLDADEDWHIGANIDMFTVAVHEAGHALGLAHVDNPASVMYPYYRIGASIAADDIAAIQSLYGSPEKTSTPLTLTIATPAARSTTSASSIVATGTASGGNGAIRITWQTDHGSSGVASGTTKWIIPSIPLTVGSNTITVTAADGTQTAAQTAVMTRTPPASLDRTPPTLAITYPAGNVMTTTSALINIKGTATDASGVARVTWQTAAGLGTATGSTNWTATGVPLVLGDNTIMIRAYDATGNMSWRTVLVIRN